MRLRLSRFKNFIFGEILHDKESENEYINLLFEKYGEDFFKEVYLKYQQGLPLDQAFKEMLFKEGKVKKVRVRKIGKK
jgi:hypothetical protein